LQQDYVDDCTKGLERWNRVLAEVGVELRLPHPGFHRAVGVFKGHYVSPDGRLLREEEWETGVGSWLPTRADEAHVASLMRSVTDPGQMASWIAPPATGVNGRPVDFEYVRAPHP
jgi:benzoyl-CoA 2,3-dioxygenase component B